MATPTLARPTEEHVETLHGEQLSLSARAKNIRVSNTGSHEVSAKEFALRSIPIVAMAVVLASAMGRPLSNSTGMFLVGIELVLLVVTVLVWVPKHN